MYGEPGIIVLISLDGMLRYCWLLMVVVVVVVVVEN
jgi:hypothetical protein